MVQPLLNFFRLPDYDSMEATQKARFLHVGLLVSTVASLLLAFNNLGGESSLEYFLFTMSGISLLCIPAIRRGYYTLVALLISILVLVLMTFSMLEGIGLRDAGMLVYPLFIIFVSFLFNKNAALFATLVSMGSIAYVYLYEQAGKLHPVEYSPKANFMVMSILFLATGFFLWVYMENWERINQNLRQTYDLTLSGWGKALEYRDHETQGHSRRVVDLTLQIAGRLGISGTELDHIRRGALLHDIGKMAVPDDILLKPDKLTHAEWEIVKRHPEHAKNLLEDIPFLEPAIEIPYSHHERWDGSGYPQGLAGEDIPIAARIFAVVDVWDALISDRPYRKAWSHQAARDYLVEHSSILFDPRVVNEFLAILIPGVKA